MTPTHGADYYFKVEATRCPNAECQELTLTAELEERDRSDTDDYPIEETINPVQNWSLLPRSMAIPMPDYVPEEVRKNYLEACLIKNDSPKASAAMSRRCLQGILRDFWEIPQGKRGKLGAEISFVQDKINPDTFESIKAVREVGDIGAHMEKSVDTIVDVEPEEASLLIELIETLISDWYVERHVRKTRNTALRKTVAAKRQAKKLGKEATKQIEDQSEK